MNQFKDVALSFCFKSHKILKNHDFQIIKTSIFFTENIKNLRMQIMTSGAHIHSMNQIKHLDRLFGNIFSQCICFVVSSM